MEHKALAEELAPSYGVVDAAAVVDPADAPTTDAAAAGDLFPADQGMPPRRHKLWKRGASMDRLFLLQVNSAVAIVFVAPVHMWHASSLSTGTSYCKIICKNSRMQTLHYLTFRQL